MHVSSETGPEFELRALEVARARHDPSGRQGAIMFRNRERDGLFVSDENIHAYEFTTSRTKNKALKDAEKVRELLTALKRLPENRFKSAVGWVVTREEPTADQRSAISSVQRTAGFPIYLISLGTLQAQICNSDEYLRLRGAAPWGSISYARNTVASNVNVEASLRKIDDSEVTPSVLARELLNGVRALVIGEFGVGKSHTLRELYQDLRKNHLRTQKLTPFPLHINLRECMGLRSATEVIRRHAEEIGFQNGDSLISAWRSGACVLLLDGFDEIVPTRWLGGLSDLKDVRWKALSAVRQLVSETPKEAGVAVCGRAHYFSSRTEMTRVLGLEAEASILELTDFTEAQVKKYLELTKVESVVPDWLPARPLLIGYLVASVDMGSLPDFGSVTEAQAWRGFLDSICEREAIMLKALSPDTIKSIISRVATLARSQGDEVGPIALEMMEKAYINVCGQEPDEEGKQLLLRLPGLANDERSENSRVFVDASFTNAAYGEDLARHVLNPYGHEAIWDTSWYSAASTLGIEVAAERLEDKDIDSGYVLGVASQRDQRGRHDAVLADLLRVTAEIGSEKTKSGLGFLVDGVYYQTLSAASDPVTASIKFQQCLVDTLDVSGWEENSFGPSFQACLIGQIDGLSSMPQWLDTSFVECDIESFSSESQTTAGILTLSIPLREKIALTILKKIYLQRGSGRKEGALYRGLDHATRKNVPSVLSALITEGWIVKTSARKHVIYLPVKGQRPAALRILEKPGDFRLES